MEPKFKVGDIVYSKNGFTWSDSKDFQLKITEVIVGDYRGGFGYKFEVISGICHCTGIHYKELDDNSTLVENFNV